MNKKIIALVAPALLAMPISTYAVSSPVLTNNPGKVDAQFFTLKIKVDSGSKVTVLGGPSNIPPVTDGAGKDALDGMVEVMVGLAQEKDNTFSMVSEKDGATSKSVTFTITEGVVASDSGSDGDTVAPDRPVIKAPSDPISYTKKYLIKGSAETDANIYVRRPDGVKVGSTRANSKGLFEVEVPLQAGKTNRFNVSAEDAAYNEGLATQVVIKVAKAPQVEEKAMEEKTEVKTEVKKTEKSSDMIFVDVRDHWSKAFVSKIYNKGIVKGKAKDRFAPNDRITRAELLKIALKSFDHSVEAQVSETSFRDVAKKDWFAPFVEKARRLKIASGYDDGFRPNQPISRAAALKILLEASGLNLGDGITDFKDVRSKDWFRKYVAFAKANDIVGGYSDGTFRPNATITRAEVAKIVVKIMELKEEQENPTI